MSTERNPKRPITEVSGTDEANVAMKLEYFDGRGLGEVSRIIMKIAGVEFDDTRYSIAFPDGKMDAPEFVDLRDKGHFDSNMGRLPVLHTMGECELLLS
jgi:hypothetical protein